MSLNWYLIDSLSQRCSLSPDRFQYIIDRLIDLNETDDEFELSEIETLMQELRENQHDPIPMGMNYSQTDILNHLKKLK